MIYRQKWKKEKEIQSWSVFLACSTKFLLTLLPISHFLQSSEKLVSHFLSHLNAFCFTYWVFYSKSRKKEKKILHLDWKFDDLCYLLGVTLIGIFEEISGTQANHIAISIIQVYILPLLSNLIRFPSNFPSKSSCYWFFIVIINCDEIFVFFNANSQ